MAVNYSSHFKHTQRTRDTENRSALFERTAQKSVVQVGAVGQTQMENTKWHQRSKKKCVCCGTNKRNMENRHLKNRP